MASEKEIRDDIDRVKQGNPKYRPKLAQEGKLFVRERLHLYFPEGPAFEDGLFAEFGDPDIPADGMVTGAGEAPDGRRVFFIANDYTVKAGSMAEMGVEKFLRVQERALRARRPILYLIDSSGARIDKQAGFFAQRGGIGRYFYNHSLLSGVVPQISVMYGPCVAGAAYTPVFCDFNIMVRKTSALCIASPRMVEMVTGERIAMSELGGPDMHMAESGSADFVVDGEEEAAEVALRLLSYLPDSADHEPPRAAPVPPERAFREDLMPENPNVGFDVRDAIAALVDAGSFLEVKAGYAPELVVGFARIEGRVVGLVANQPKMKAGAIFPESSDKAAEFIWKCDAFNVPLLFLCDTPGFMVGSAVERQGILRRGRKFIYATSMATVPKLTLVLRKAYGAGLYAMCGGAYEPESVLATPQAAIAVMGPEAAINAVYFNKIKDLQGEERERRVKELQEEYRADIDVHRLAARLIVDAVIPPSELRTEIARRYAWYERKDPELLMPRRKHGTVL